MSRIVGYTRTLPGSQDANDVARLRDAGAVEVFQDAGGIAVSTRPRLVACLQSLNRGDVFVVPTAAHLSHTVTHFLVTTAALRRDGVAFRSLEQPALSAGAAGDSDATEVYLALDELKRELKSLSTRAGLELAAFAGQPLGRPTVMTPERIAMAVELRRQRRSIAHIARLLGVSASAVQRALNALDAS